MTHDPREYECIVFGATGYTGKYTAEHVVKQLPTDFKWAIAGRSESKLRTLAEDLRVLDPNRTAPAIEVAQLDETALLTLAQKTKVLVSTVGPYHKYGSKVFKACAETGTHYLDVTGEVPWVHEMIQKYHHIAQGSGAIMIPQNGVESAPADLLCWMLASHIRNNQGVGTAEIVYTTHRIKASASGGTLATVLTLFDTYSLADVAKTQNPWCICPVQAPSKLPSRPALERWTGHRNVPDLGHLTDSIQGPADMPIVHRSWGLYEKGRLYGPNFRMNAYMTAANALTSFGFHLAFTAGMIALMLPPVRWLLQKLVYQAGDGPEREKSKSDFVEWRAIANADVADSGPPRRVFGKMRYEGSLYDLTGLCLATSALVLAREESYANELGGGVLTPATLGSQYLEKLQKGGLKFEMLDLQETR